MECSDNTSLEGRARARLQQDFLSTIQSLKKKPKTLKKRIRILENYLKNPFFDINFQMNGISPLAKATSEWKILDRLLQHNGIEVNFCNSDGRTSIFFAVECSGTESLRLLVNKGALLDQRDNEGRTPLSLAAELGRLDHMRILVESNANINLADSKSWTPLFWAISGQHIEMVKYLLSKKGVNIDLQDVNGRTPLAIAAETGNAESMRYLIDTRGKGRQMIGFERDLLLWAILQRDIITVQSLLKADESLANHPVKGRTPLSMAVELGDVGITKLLIDAGADVHAIDGLRWPVLGKWPFETYLPPDETLLQIEHFSTNHHPTKQPPLLLAAEFQCIDIVQLLLDANAEVNSVDAQKWTALAWAVEKGHSGIVKILLGMPGIAIDSRDATDRTPLIMAASLGEINILDQLLKSNAAINSEDKQKWTSLSWAVANRHERTVESLLSTPGLCVDHQDEQGRTPFSLAAERGFIRIMHLLIGKGADPHVPDNEGHTGFWWFLKARHDLLARSSNPLGRPGLDGTVNPFTLQLLIGALPMPNRKDRSGRNWLSWAAEYGDEEVIRYFLEVEDKADKVDVNICDGSEDTFSRTPLIWALERGHVLLIDLLKGDDTISLHLLVEGISSIEQEKLLGLAVDLLQAGYNPNQPDEKGRTPLHLACLRGSQEFVSTLIRADADPRSRDHTGEIPLQYALKARSKAVVNLLLNAPSTDLKPIQSKEWFAMGSKEYPWIQITRRSQGGGFELELIEKLGCDWLPRAKETRLCICEKPLIWSLLPRELHIQDKLKDRRYWNYAHKEFGYRIITYISLAFPNKQEEGRYPWGIAWTSRKTAEGLAYGFISMLPSGWVPNNPLEFFRLFLETLHQEWNTRCSTANAKVELLRHDQVKKRGRSHDLVDELAKNALDRAELRQCLQSHVEGLLDVVTTDVSLEIEHKPQLREVINGIDQAITAKIDHQEQAVRDLLQIELAWVSANEAASFKRLSWITFIFLPLMFVSSLFGMNVDLLRDNPDWRWYILFGGISLVITGGLWLVSKCVPQVVQGNVIGIFSRQKRGNTSSRYSV